MTEERFTEILDAHRNTGVLEGCRILNGLKIIAKYLPKNGIDAAEHDQVWSVEFDDIANAGLTEEDAVLIAAYGWFIDEGALSHYV